MPVLSQPRTATRSDAARHRREAVCGGGASAKAGQRTPKRIAFFGNFGTQNLGNEYTLKSILQNARRFVPEAELSCICTDPQDVSARHGVPAVLMSYRYSREFRSRAQGRTGIFALRMLRRLFLRLPQELLELLRAWRALRGVTMLVMSGTGMLSDVGIGPLDLHYEILKWSALARLRGAKVAFVSVGVGPIADPVSRFIVKRALSLAGYRSYRDDDSKEYLERIGFDSSGDRVRPDLAFSLPPRVHGEGGARTRVVGIGLMDYYGTRRSSRTGEEAYLDYVTRMTELASWLLERGYEVHLVVGDLSYDTRCKNDVLRRLRESAPGQGGAQAVDVPVGSAEELVEALARMDVVIATRFHTLVLALMLDKPVLALSYHEKIASLMAAAGLPQYCHDVDGSDAARLIGQFIDLERHASTITASIARRTADCRRALDEQYELLFGRA